MNIANNRVLKTTLVFLFITMTMPEIVCGQTTDQDLDKPIVTKSEITGTVPAGTARIVKYFVDTAHRKSDYETGSIHIVYSDGTEVVVTLLPKEKSTEREMARNQEGFENLKVSGDTRTIGWTETFDYLHTTYSVPLVLSIYQSGKTILHIQHPLVPSIYQSGKTRLHMEHLQLISFWTFLDEGKHLGTVWRPSHEDGGSYELYDTKTGNLLEEPVSFEDEGLKPNAPEWAKETEEAYKARRKAP